MNIANHVYRVLTLAFLAALIAVVYYEGEKATRMMATIGYGGDMNVHMVKLVNGEPLTVSVKGAVEVNGGHVDAGQFGGRDLPVSVRVSN